MKLDPDLVARYDHIEVGQLFLVYAQRPGRTDWLALCCKKTGHGEFHVVDAEVFAKPEQCKPWFDVVRVTRPWEAH